MSISKYSAALAGLSLFATATVMVAGVAFVLHISSQIQPQLAEATDLKDKALAFTSEVYDRQGEKIGEFAAEQRYYMPLKELPKPVIQAFLSAEDKDFYHHYGISPLSALRAVYANLRGGHLRQGASTITQQLARLFFLDQSKTWERKIKEALLALAIERRLSKDEILELYLNKIYLGNHSYGIEAAARNYFRKHANQLDVAEAALLAGLPKSPNAYAPHRHPDAATKRQLLVLRRMAEDGVLSAAEAAMWAKKQVAVARGPEDFSRGAAYVIQAVRAEISRKFEYKQLPHRGLRIYTTLDARLQSTASAHLKASLKHSRTLLAKHANPRDEIEGALLSLEPNTGAILAMQGGGDFSRSQYNRTAATKRPIGALFLPVYVGLALERGYTLLSRVGDDPLGGHGAAGNAAPTLYDVLRRGSATAGAPLYAALGHGSVQAFARRLGLHFAQTDLGLAYGSGKASPLQIAVAYAAFSNGGHIVTPHLIERITTTTDKLLYAAPAAESSAPAISPSTAYIVNEALRDAVAYGHAIKARGVASAASGIGAATEDLHDAWYVGALPNILTVLWAGAETGQVRFSEHEDLAVAQLAATWAAYMKAAPKAYIEQAIMVPVPANISFARRPQGAAPGSQSLPFLSGTEPKLATHRAL